MKSDKLEIEIFNQKKGIEGFVYIFSNPSLQGLLKIGRTSNIPDVRAKSLSSSSAIPKNFVIEWSKKVANIALAEMMLHYTLHEYSESKEFFNIPIDDAKKICDEALNRLFKPIKSKEKLRIKGLEKEALEIEKELESELKKLKLETDSGIVTIPVGEKNVTWEMVSNSLEYSFGKKAIALCIKEGKSGDPIRKRFISYRSNYLSAKRVDLFFNKSHITLNVVSKNPDEVKKQIKKIFKIDYKKLKFSLTNLGFSFQIDSNELFVLLKKYLNMGSEIKIGKNKFHKLL